ncbi:Ribonucleotide reductase of class II (coenzyme B12-dependent) [Caenispirillum salinarum AK4]|uniref:Ribonucleoside-diphosphate reductase n=1 Tax=Caenispirillum salinarum AK4 TaxID=1238182 RepID=K9GTD7_9PROT|nr:ribonucleotide reductase N-terminal alpha domain-containing protein [Caenispirillum salinarum]EKV29255.1 Ribonucleotide reductase of class II (coenzyme B12-dependent) [Caenispirillum salinarum AK4]
MHEPTGIAQQIWDMKYRLKQADGTAIDRTVEDTWARVARALAAPEAEPAAWEPRFLEALRDFVVLPAGRILAGAGTRRRVTLFNCFVMGRIEDDMASIFEHLKEAALTMQQGGGIGYDFSTLRPRGAPVQGVQSDASGPISFMDVWDAMCRTIMSAGSRRGAMMGVLRCDHPDIEEFIDAKRDPGRLRMFNVSVLVTDAFMDAVREDADWPLVFGGVTYRTIRARALWDRIMRATYDVAEPGVIFIDRINERNTLRYCEEISSTNPCVTADTWIHTAEGPRQVAELIKRPFTALVDGVPHASTPQGFFATGTRPVLRLETREGPTLTLTPNHRVRLADGTWRPAGDLRPGDRVLLHDHAAAPAWTGPGQEPEGYLMGLLIGGGRLEADTAVLCLPADGTAADVAEAAARAARGLPGATGATDGVEHLEDEDGRRMLVHDGVRALARSLGLGPEADAPIITPAMESASTAFQVGLLRGLADGAGTLDDAGPDAARLRIAHASPGVLAAAQRLCLRLGLPAMRGDTEGSDPASVLTLAGPGLRRFAWLVGSHDATRTGRLEALTAAGSRPPPAPRPTATVAGLTEDGSRAVFDCSIPGANAFDANGLYVHNCGEQPLPPYGTCLLGSVNLAKMVDRPFEEGAALDLDLLEARVAVAVRMLDNVIDVSGYPLDAQRQEALAKRRIGLGVTGLADALVMCGARYGSADAVRLTEAWLARLQRAAYLTSAALAAEKGPFPLYDRDAYMASPTIQALDGDVREAIAATGMRNGLVTSIAPTGTISLYADNVSSGLEPVFSYTYTRRVLMPDGSRREETVADFAYALFRERFGRDAPLPPAFVSAMELSPRDHLVMQAAVQKYIDSGISKTINVPEDIDFEAFQDVYRQAYDLGCKGCTTYRPNAVTGAVLELAREEGNAAAGLPTDTLPPEPGAPEPPHPGPRVPETITAPPDRPETLPGYTYKLRWPESDHATYITINDVVEHGRRRPFEVFINSKNMEHYAWTVALTRMISAVFRRGGDIGFVVEELKAVFDPRGGQWMNGRYVPSILAAIGGVIEQHMIRIGFLKEDDLPRLGRSNGNGAGPGGADEPGGPARLRTCPKCGQPALVRQEGCDTCTACGYSRCS